MWGRDRGDVGAIQGRYRGDIGHDQAAQRLKGQLEVVVTLHLPASRHISPHLRTHLHISPYLRTYLPAYLPASHRLLGQLEIAVGAQLGRRGGPLVRGRGRGSGSGSGSGRVRARVRVSVQDRASGKFRVRVRVGVRVGVGGRGRVTGRVRGDRLVLQAARSRGDD
jgi:hypothetical protein